MSCGECVTEAEASSGSCNGQSTDQVTIFGFMQDRENLARAIQLRKVCPM